MSFLERLYVGAALLAVFASVPFGAHAASSRGLVCQIAGKLAADAAIEMDGCGRQYRPQLELDDGQKRIDAWARRCEEDPRGIEECVKALCMQEPS